MQSLDPIARSVLGLLLATHALQPASAQDCANLPPAATCRGGIQTDTTFGEPPTLDSCFGCPLGVQDGTWSCASTGYRPLRAPKFAFQPGVCGSLIQVDVTIEYEGRVQYQIENLDNKPQTVLAQLILEVDLPDPIDPNCVTGTTGLPGIGPVSLPLVDNQLLPLPQFDGTIDFAVSASRIRRSSSSTSRRRRPSS
jgi:hypothetical protein